MTLTQILTASALALTLALPLAAQTTTDGETQPGGDLSLGVTPGAGLPTQETAEPGQIYFVQAYDSWELRCKKAADGSDPCNLYQLLKDGTGNPVAEISLFALPDGQEAVAGANVIAPLETLLTRNLGLAIDGAQAKVYPFAFCTKDGCIARLGFTAEEIAAMQKGAVAKVTIVPAAAPDKEVVLAISLKGFTAGFDAVKASRPKQ